MKERHSITPWLAAPRRPKYFYFVRIFLDVFGGGGAYCGQGVRATHIFGARPSCLDVYYLVRTILHTWYGDATLDGKVDFIDFQALLDHWQYSGGWADGDFNGDGIADFLDFQMLLDNWNPEGVGN